jgi:hypothetical protein
MVSARWSSFVVLLGAVGCGYQTITLGWGSPATPPTDAGDPVDPPADPSIPRPPVRSSKDAGQAWSPVGLGISDGVDAFDFAVDPTGTPYAATAACRGGANGGFSGCDWHTWQIVEGEVARPLAAKGSIDDRAFGSPTLASDSDGRMLLGVNETDVRILDATDWISLPSIFATAGDPPIALLDLGGHPVIVPAKMPAAPRDGSLGIHRLTENGIWDSVGGPAEGWLQVRAAFGRLGAFYVAHSDVEKSFSPPDGNIVVHRLIGLRWEQVGTGAAAMASRFDLAVGPDDTPYLATIDSQGRAVTVVSWRDGAWLRVGSPIGDVGVDQTTYFDQSAAIVASPSGLYTTCNVRSAWPSFPGVTIARWTGGAWKSIYEGEPGLSSSPLAAPLHLRAAPDGALYAGSLAGNDLTFRRYR